jgi:Arc/MetJ-type ribon-helix-helix transcriptional regulator
MVKNMVVINLNEEQTNMINEMVPMYGENDSEVIKTIIVMFLHENMDKIDILLSLTESQENPPKGPTKFLPG